MLKRTMFVFCSLPLLIHPLCLGTSASRFHRSGYFIEKTDNCKKGGRGDGWFWWSQKVGGGGSYIYIYIYKDSRAKFKTCSITPMDSEKDISWWSGNQWTKKRRFLWLVTCSERLGGKTRAYHQIIPLPHNRFYKVHF